MSEREMTPARLAEIERYYKTASVDISEELCAALRAAWRALACMECDPEGQIDDPEQSKTRDCRACGKARILAMLREEKP